MSINNVILEKNVWGDFYAVMKFNAKFIIERIINYKEV
ncbi:hypothetical protein Thert_00344 [Thermoanaerobacterium thermosaccharolyticum]|uniref:Uncharacterized protein n=1 Tax=Thermoanaerobacterium thermosaccharolyticum TaxID=1517 RepID=A0A223HVP3_THETR|nr:hypothetical protein Thert_00344 [Thermoanaerobacterium thermosaccharolyticum]